MNNNQEGVSSILSIADLLRGDYKPFLQGGVVLPQTVVWHLDCVLRPKIGAVLETASGLPKKADQAMRDLTHCLVSGKGMRFDNTSKLAPHPRVVANGEAFVSPQTLISAAVTIKINVSKEAAC